MCSAPRQHRRMDEGKIGVPGHESLGEDDELARPSPPPPRSAASTRATVAARRLQIGRDLHRGDADVLILRPSHPPASAAAMPDSPGRHSVQVSSMKALSRRCSRMRSSTSSGLIGRDALDQRRLAVAVERLQGETAGIDLAAFAHELGELIVEVVMPGKRLVADFGKAALHAERHAGAIEKDRGLEPFAQEPRA